MKFENEYLIKKWEALRLEAYLPTKDDVWTIGWGHTAGVYQGMKITKQEAELYFDEDVAWASEAVNKLVRVKLSQNQFDALVSFVFNIGLTAFKKSTLLRKLNAGDYHGAAAEFPKWNKQAGKVLNGLVKRRAEEMEYFLLPSDEEVVSRKVDEVEGFKNIFASKELVGGLTMFLAGISSFLSNLSIESQDKLVNIMTIGLIGFGLLFAINRIIARVKGQR